MIHNCIKCGVPLNIGENVTQYQIDTSQYACRTCRSKYCNNYKHLTGRQRPMSKNKECSAFLGVHVAERVLSHIFKNVQKMPINHPGFDFICGRGYNVDVKSACRRCKEKHADSWDFNIKKNQIAEYFLCLAFDNRKNLTPEHIWFIPANEINDRGMVCIVATRLDKWAKYELPIDQVVTCCHDMVNRRNVE